MRFFDADEYDGFEYNSKEEDHLLQKFNDYVNLEKKISKQGFLEVSDETTTGKVGKKFIISAMIQGAIVAGLTIALFINQILVFNGNIKNMFEFSFTDSLGIFFFGFILQIGLTAGLALMGIFYNHIEANKDREIKKFGKILSLVNLYSTNILGNVITISLIFAGIATSVLYQTEFSYVLKTIPSLVYVSAISLVIILGISVMGTALAFIQERKND